MYMRYGAKWRKAGYETISITNRWDFLRLWKYLLCSVRGHYQYVSIDHLRGGKYSYGARFLIFKIVINLYLNVNSYLFLQYWMRRYSIGHHDNNLVIFSMQTREKEYANELHQNAIVLLLLSLCNKQKFVFCSIYFSVFIKFQQ